MPRYKVRPGAVLAHGGQLLEQGAIVELPRHVGEDSVVRDLVQEIDETGAPVAPLDQSDLDVERFRPHERITLLQNRLDEARALVSRLEQRIVVEKQTIAEATPTSVAPPASSFARVPAQTDEE